MAENKLSKDQVTFKGHTFIPVVLGDAQGPLYKFSQREVKFLYALTSTWNLEAACQEIGIDLAKAKRFLSKKHIIAFLEEKSRERALAAGLTMDNHMAWLREVRDGVKLPSESALDASKQITRILRPEGGRGVNVTVNTQVNVAASPYEKLTPEQLMAGMSERVNAIQGGSAESTGIGG
jgi:hypothetical protein